MAVSRADRIEIYSKVASCIREKGPINTNQISDETDINWETVKTTVESLEKAGFVILEGKQYSIQNECNFNSNTILGLPLNQEQENLFIGIANRIQELSPKRLNRTFLQKAVVRVIEKANIDTLPFGWYLFGKCTILQFQNLNSSNQTKKYDAEIKETIDEINKFSNTDELMQEQYKNNSLYMSRLIMDQMCKQKFTKENLKVVEFQIKNIIFNFKLTEENKELFEYIEGFYSLFVRLLKLDIDEIESLRMDIFSAFRVIWELIGTYLFYENTKKFYRINTTPYYKLREYVLKEISNNYMQNLDGYLPLTKPVDDVLRKFKGARAK